MWINFKNALLFKKEKKNVFSHTAVCDCNKDSSWRKTKNTMLDKTTLIMTILQSFAIAESLFVVD